MTTYLLDKEKEKVLGIFEGKEGKGIEKKESRKER